MSAYIAFAIGDVVRLNSGGPEMIVCGLGQSERWVECFWFGDDGEYQEATFRDVMLTHVEVR